MAVASNPTKSGLTASSLILVAFLLAATHPVGCLAQDWRLIGQVGGQVKAVAVQGAYLYAGIGLRLLVLDISDPTDIREVGRSKPLRSLVEHVVVRGGFAFVAAGEAGLRILDVSDPTRPTEAGSWDSPGYAESSDLGGDTLYLADGPTGIQILNVADPAHPTKIASLYCDYYAFRVAVRDRYAYVAAGGAGLLVADIGDPSRPSHVASLDTRGYAYSVSLADNVTYVADGWEGVTVVDVSDPARPTLTGTRALEGWATDLQVSGSMLYVAGGSAGLHVLDVTDPAGPVELGGYRSYSAQYVSVAAAGSMAYIADRLTGVLALDASKPLEPTEAGRYETPAVVNAVAAVDGLVIVSTVHAGLWTVDFADPERPRQIGHYDMVGFGECLAADGRYAFAFGTDFSSNSGLHVVDLSDPANPRRAAFLTHSKGACREMVLSGSILYASTEQDLVLFDVSNPAKPEQVGRVSLNDWPERDRETIGVAVADGFAFVTGGMLKVVDVRDPRNPQRVGIFWGPPPSGQDIAVAGGFGYLSGPQGLTILSLADPINPVRLASVPPLGQSESLVVSGTTLYLMAGGMGFVEYDIRDPASPVFKGGYRTAGYARRLALNRDMVLIGDFQGGLAVLGRNDVSRGSPVVSAISRRRIPAGNLRTFREAAATAPRSPAAARGGADCVVTSSGDSGSGTLRECLQLAKPGTRVLFRCAYFPGSVPNGDSAGQPSAAVDSRAD